MAKKQEGEKAERIIRALLKLPENRRCVNCRSLDPQYVCTTFLTFVCRNCSEIHRGFTHRVKSLSVAKFNAEEASSLQVGGNERAMQIYFKKWDQKHNSYPDSSNLYLLRDFIKQVYVERRYTGDGSLEKLPRLRLGGMEDVCHGKFGSADCEDKHEWSQKLAPGGRKKEKGFKFYYDERRSPRYCRENSRSGGFKKCPIRFEVVDDRVRDDKIQSVKPADSHVVSPRETCTERSLDSKKKMLNSSSPKICPVNDSMEGAVLSQKVNSSLACTGVIREDPIKAESSNLVNLIDLDTINSNASTGEDVQISHGENDTDISSAKQAVSPIPKPNTPEFLHLELSIPPEGNTVAPDSAAALVEPISDASAIVAPGGLLTNQVLETPISQAPFSVSAISYVSNVGQEGNFVHMHQNVARQCVPAYPSITKSENPFDWINKPTSLQSLSLSMAGNESVAARAGPDPRAMMGASWSNFSAMVPVPHSVSSATVFPDGSTSIAHCSEEVALGLGSSAAPRRGNPFG